MFKTRIFVLSLIGVTILGILLWRSPPDEFSEFLNSTTKIPDYPSTFLVGASTRQYDEKGQLNYILDANTIQYYPDAKADEAEVVMLKPILKVFEQEADSPTEIERAKPSLRISADTAEGRQEQDELELKGTVVLKQQRDDGG